MQNIKAGNSYINTKFVVTYQNNKKKSFFKYNDISDEIRKRLRSQFIAGTITIECCCQEKIEQGVSKIFSIYNLSKNKPHARNCCKFMHYSNSSEYEQGWKEEEDGHFTIRLQEEDVKKPPAKEKVVGSMMSPGATANDQQEKKEKGSSPAGSSKTKGQVTLLGLATKLNMMAWERKAEQSNLPTHPFQLLHQVYGLLNKVHLRKGDAGLQAAFITNHSAATPDLLTKRGLFFYLLFSNVVERKSARTGKPVYYVHGNYKLGSKVEEYRFLINHSMFEQAQEWKRSGEGYMICGFAHPYVKAHPQILFTCKEMVAFKVTQQGLYYESNYEKKAYEYFISQKRLFIKPYRNMIEYEDRRPDAIFIDRNPMVLGEIFGMNTDAYLLKRKKKIACAQKNANLYGFWYWDAFDSNSKLYID